MSHIHTVPKSTSESQAQITYLLTAPEHGACCTRTDLRQSYHEDEVTVVTTNIRRVKVTEGTFDLFVIYSLYVVIDVTFT